MGLVAFDRSRCKRAGLIGIDEAGRGALAGPVVASAVYCCQRFYATKWCAQAAESVDDSKRLSAERRERVVECFRAAIARGWIQVGIGFADVAEIDRYNILGATQMAMHRALLQVATLDRRTALVRSRKEGGRWDPAPLLVDGRPLRGLGLDHEAIVKGDSQSLAIALAGIHAKVARDSAMMALGKQWPEYGFGTHKGYGTPAHLVALREQGPSKEHRSLFVATALGQRNAVTEDSLFPEAEYPLEE
jgi:ribonuclease HII